MELRFYIDPATNQPHIFRHGVEEVEVVEVMENPGEDRPGREGSRIVIGQTASGRYLRVIFVRDAAQDSAFVVTAYELDGKQLAAYRRRRRRKGK